MSKYDKLKKDHQPKQPSQGRPIDLWEEADLDLYEEALFGSRPDSTVRYFASLAFPG